MNEKNISVGQTYRVINPDYYVLHETWEVTAVDHPAITFSVTKYWLRDAAYVHISSTDTVVGMVYQENEHGVFLATSGALDWTGLKVILKGDEASYLFDKIGG